MLPGVMTHFHSPRDSLCRKIPLLESVMTGGEELVGKVNIQTAILRLLLFSLLILNLVTGCNQSKEKTEPKTDSNAKALVVADVYEKCGDILFAALFHLPNTQHFFENRKQLVGQPAYYFSDLLTQEEKENILMQLTQLYKQADGSDELVTFNRSINQWCEAYQTIQQLQHQHSFEEFLAGLLKSKRFKYLFSQHDGSPIFQSDEFSAFEKAASLSSAQGQDVISTLTTDLSMQTAPEFELDITALKELYQS